MLKNFKLNGKILIVLITTTTLTAVLVGLISYTLGRDTLENEVFDKLTAVREMKASQVETYFHQIYDQLEVFSEDPMVVDAILNFKSDFQEIDTTFYQNAINLNEVKNSVKTFYMTEFIPNLQDSSELSSFLPDDTDSKSLLLQHHYLAHNPYPVGSKDSLYSVEANSSYHQTHRTYHPLFHKFLKKFGYYDIFLVDNETGTILYSVYKEVDFATSLLTGPYKDTNLAEVFRKTLSSASRNEINIVDFRPYPPSYFKPASFIASPIYEGNEMIGVLIFQMPIDRINDIMTHNHRWEEVGLGKTGETYLVGDDFLLRNQSRFFIEDPENYFQSIEAMNVSTETVSIIRELNTTIGLQPVKTAGTHAALSGKKNTQVFKDYRGINVLSSFKALNIPGLNWVIMSEIDQSEAFESMYILFRQFIMWFLLLLGGIFFIASIFSRTISKPIRNLSTKATDLAKGNLDIEIVIDRKDEIGMLANSFEVMRKNIKKSFDDINDLNKTLEKRVEERTMDLEKATRRIKSIIENASDAIITIDSDQNIVLFNPQAEKTFGYSSDEVQGKPMTILLPETYTELHHDHVRKFEMEDVTSRAMDNRKELFGQRKDGTTFPAEAGISKMMLDGKIFFTAFLRDITERKIIEDKIREQKEMLENTLESLTHPFYVIDAEDYSIKIANSAAKELGVSNISTCYALTHKRDKPCDSKDDPCPLLAVKKDKKPVLLEHTHYNKKGEPRFVEVHGYPIFDDEGKVIQMIEYSLDITERKNMEQQLESAYETIKDQKNRMEKELNIGREIQMSLIPLTFPAFPNHREFMVFGDIIPAREVGGDFYDFYFIEKDKFFFCIGDVSGKGVPSALFMAITKTLIKSRAFESISTSHVMTHVNDEISADNKSNMFITLFIGILDISNGVITYTNAGHNRPLIKRKNGVVEEVKHIHGPVVGAIDGLIYDENTVKLESGEILMLYTDGVTEAMDIDKNLYREERLVSLLGTVEYTDPDKLIESIIADVKNFEGSAEQTDDITLLGIRYEELDSNGIVDQFNISIVNEMKEIQLVNNRFKEFASKNKISVNDTRKIQIIFDELINNIVSYAYIDDNDHLIDIHVELVRNHIRILITDDGIAFNPFQSKLPNVDLPLGQREAGGVGVHIVRNFMDQVFYQRLNNKNIVSLVKHLII